MNRHHVLILVVIGLMSVTTLSSGATGSSQRTAEKQRLDYNRIAAFSKSVEKSLAANNVNVAIISRRGRPESDLPKGVQFTHVGLAVYSLITLDDGSQQPGYAIYNLYQKMDKLDESELVQNYPFEFYAEALDLVTGVIIPKSALQQKLLDVITSPDYQTLYNPKYSVNANPFNNQKQNCTEFVLNIIQSALYETSDMNVIKTSIKTYFEPYTLPYNPLTLMVGALFSHEITVTDHRQKFQTTTFTTIAEYMKTYHLSEKIYEIREQGHER